MKSQEIKKFSKIVFILSGIILVVVSLVFICLKMYSWLLGNLLGSTTSCITYLMHVNNVEKVGVSVNNPRKNAISASLLRTAVSAISLAIALLVSWINIIATFIGLLTNKVIVIVVAFIIGSKEINKKEEMQNYNEFD